MADEEYNKKLESLQQYIPFLNNMIAQLKDPRKKNREQQLAKMVSLHSMITDKKKKLKLETLIKCEDVILKLYDKVKTGSHSQGGSRLSPSGGPSMQSKQSILSPTTPSSPSPTRDLLKTKPVVIPTEKIPDRSERDNKMCPPSSSYKNRIDIYSSAADSLKFSSQKPSVFERLGRKGPDMSKPPISMEDLEALQRDVITERMSLNELTDLREKLQKQLCTDDGDSRNSPINTTVRNTTILTKKAVVPVPTSDISKSKPAEVKPVSKQNTVLAKPVKVVKEASSIFGSALSSIDNQILDVATKTKEKERRNSTGSKKDSSETSEKSKERRSSKDDKKESEKSKSTKDKDKTEKHRSKDTKESEKSKERKDEKKDKDRKKHESSKKDHKEEKDKKKDVHKDEKKNDEDKSKIEKEKKEDDEKTEDKEKKKEDKDVCKGVDDKSKGEEPKPGDSAPVYKRLADKYNPKPRKPSIDVATPEVPKKVSDSIENSMKTAPVIPFFETPQKSPVKTPPIIIPQLSLNLPLLSPTNSSSSVDNEIAAFNRKPLLPLPQPVAGGSASIPTQFGNNQGIPSHVSSILANPNTTALINSVVNQFKGRQTPLLSPTTPNAYAHPVSPPQNQAQFHQPASNQPNFHAPGSNQQNLHVQRPPLLNQPNFHPPNQPHFHQPNQNFQPRPNQPNFHAPNEMGGPRFNPPHQPANFWNNQQQNHPQRSFTPQFDNNQQQNHPQRSFTPQFDNNQQQNHPQRSFTPQFDNHAPAHSIPPLMSPQYDGYEARPQRRPNENEREGRYRDDWRRPQSSISTSPPQQRSRDSYRDTRDPRIHRDNRDRDPRSYREDPRTTPRRESREYERDRGSGFRDPRLNRHRNERDREQPNRSRSRSMSRDSEESSNNTFSSPLDSLYSGDTYRKTGKGYGVQNFKIPKIKKEEEVENEKEAEEAKKDVKEAKKDEEKVVEKKDETKNEEKVEPKKSKEVVPEEPKEVPEEKKVRTEEKKVRPEEKKVVPEETEVVAESTPEAKPGTSTETEETVASTNVSSSTECETEAPETTPAEPEKETAEIGEISSTNDIQENQSRDETKLDDPSQTEIINKFLKKLLENERTRAAASLFIDNVSNSLDDEKLKMVVQTVKTAAEEERPKKRIVRKKLVKRGKLGSKLTMKKKQLAKRKMELRKKQAATVNEEEEDEEKEEDEDEEKEEEEGKKDEEEKEEVVVSVGERIKSRKRAAASGSPKKKKMKHKTELDLLHEDIQDMFIRDGVLTATGKRMCRLLKNDETKPQQTSPEPKRRTRNTAEKFDSKVDSEKFKVMSNVRVLLPKIPADKLAEVEDESQRYSLRRSNKGGKSYAEVDSDDEKEKEKEREKEREKQREKEREKQKERERELAKEAEREKEKEKKEELEKKEKEEKQTETPKKVKKRAKSWASGILPKRKKKSVEGKEHEHDKTIDLVEPDKNYCSPRVWHWKAQCKLCPYDGMNITKHYRVKHPDSEVLSSRLTPKKAEEAIKASRDLKLDEKEDVAVLSTRHFRFVCRFCDFEMNVQASNFYDHISTHTGEYRHLCNQCDFVSSNNKQLRLHYIKEHSSDKYSRPGWIKFKIYGYICLECNFVQMIKKSVEDHVNVYHLGEGKKILKIHLSTLDDVIVEEKKREESEDEEVNVEIKPKRRKIVERKKDKEVPPPPKLVKKEKEIDMTVFTCKTDIREENEKIEKERLQKMAELNESVKTNRQSLNFVDQLSNRLLQEQKQTPTPEVVTVKSEPIDDFLPELEPEPEQSQPEPVLEVATKKHSKVIEPAASSIPAVQKDNTMIQGMIQKLQGILEPPAVPKDNTVIQGMIQKLQGILKDEKSGEGPPPLAPLLEKPVDNLKVFLNAGFLNISKLPEGLVYACRVPSCLFATTNRNGFVSHWSEDHTRINQDYKFSKCRICNEEVRATADAALLTNFFAHVENEHLCGITTSFNAGLISVDKDKEGSDEYNCRVLSCGFMTKQREKFVVHLNENHPSLKDSSKTTKCGICQSTITASLEETLLGNLFVHLESNHLQDAQPKILRTRRLSGDKLSSTKEELPETKEEDENPFPFKISGVMSLAEEQMPPLSPIRDIQPSKTTKIESVILKEAKMNTVEKAAVWKCAEATKKFLQCPRELYKCPQFFCKYCTSWRHLFETHIKAHARVNDELVSCVYCDVKTPLSHAGLHIDLRHSNCLYSCSQCLYRALTREYVMVHNKVKHKENDLIISLPPKTAKTIMMSKQKKYTPKEVCLPYKCGKEKCGEEFLFLNEFSSHLHNDHDGIMICKGPNLQTKCNFKCLLFDNMVDHWRSHGVYNFTCLLCKYGCMELYAMLEHYSLTHPNMEPAVVDRRTGPKSDYIYGYVDGAISAMKYSNEELLESVNSQQYTVVAAKHNQEALEPCETQNIALVPLSLIQPNSENKLIALKIDPPPKAVPSFVFASISENKEKEELPKDEARIEDVENDVGADPLSLDSCVLASGDESDAIELNECSDMKSFGLIGYQLFRCAFCDISFSNSRDFKAHCMHSTQCRDTNKVRQFKCVHCQRLFKNPHGLLEHIQYHGQLRFGCCLCVKKFPSSFSLKLHMRIKHNVTNTITTPVVPNKTNHERDEFVLRPAESDFAKEGANIPNIPVEKSVYGPDELDKLPKRYIFNSDIKCALCSYSTKVRTNLVRHLQFHSSEKSVPDIAPVNPVPCLDKNERMFDKMTNLANSSIAGSSTGRMGGVKTESKSVKEEHPQVPAYVPSHRRYVCCAEDCNYLCLEESNLRHHLHALHIQEPSFVCVHCKATLKADVEGYLKHLKLHDLHLYKCSGCSFVHNLRHKVDKHAADKHPEKTTHTITIRALETEMGDVDQSAMINKEGGVTDATPPSNIKWTKPWHCGMCKYRCAAKTEIVTHISNKHDQNTQYKCTLCSYKTDEKNTFETHFKEQHPDNEIDIIHIYYKSEGAVSTATNQKQFDTTPLWQRDRPRVRHIRGILFEESTPQKMTKKSGVSGRGNVSSSSAPNTSPTNLDLAIDAVATGTDDVTKRVEAKETKDDSVEDSVIIIDDDDDEEEIEIDKLLDESNSLLIDIGEAGPSEVKEESSEKLLSEEVLIDKHGKLCAPIAKAFKCPFCMKFRTRRVSFFVYHLLVEMKCYRFKCNLCDYTSVAFDAMLPHCQLKHDSLKVTHVSDMPLPKTVEYWLQLILKYQSKTLYPQPILHPGEEASSSAAKLQCEYCKKWFKSLHLLKEHELYHWATHTYTCNHCLSDYDTLNELFQHNFLAHPAYELSFKTNGPYVSKVIATLRSPPPAPTPQGGLVNEVWVTQYACSYCSEAESSVEALQRHVNEFHEGEEFSYKAVTKHKVEVMFCCTYCHERGPEKLLKQHHAEKHEGSKFNIYQFICLECSVTFLNIKDLRAHFTKSHSGKKLTYSCVENKLGGSKDQFCCVKCPFRSCSIGGIRAHLRKHVRPIDCVTCGATFIYPTEARAHHTKEHVHNAEKVEENKERLKEYEEMIQQIVANKTKSKGPPPVKKMLARKSTGAPFTGEYSFYGSKKEETDLKSVSTSIEVNKVTKKISAEQFSNIFNIFPVVEVKDCERNDEEES